MMQKDPVSVDVVEIITKHIKAIIKAGLQLFCGSSSASFSSSN